MTTAELIAVELGKIYDGHFEFHGARARKPKKGEWKKVCFPILILEIYEETGVPPNGEYCIKYIDQTGSILWSWFQYRLPFIEIKPHENI